MNTKAKIAIVVVLVIAAVVAVAVRQNKSARNLTGPGEQAAAQQIPPEYKREQITAKGLPALIDVGAGTCIPCKLMAPILEEH